MLGKLALISGAILVIGAGIKKLGKSLAESSPFLKGIFSMFKRASMQFFRPFGDFLATLLKPLALLLLRATAKWLIFTRKIALTPEGKAAAEALAKLPGKGPITARIDIKAAEEIVKALPKDTQEFFDRISGGLKGAFDLIRKGIAEIAFPEGAEEMKKAFLEKFDEAAKTAKEVALPGGEIVGLAFKKLSNRFTNILEGKAAESADKASFDPIWSAIRDGGIENIKKSADKKAPEIDSVWDVLKESTLGFFKRPITGGIRSRQTGGRIEETGAFLLHKGEEVIPRNRASSGRTNIIRPVFNFMGSITKEIDIDSVMRRANRQTELAIRRFTS